LIDLDHGSSEGALGFIDKFVRIDYNRIFLLQLQVLNVSQGLFFESLLGSLLLSKQSVDIINNIAESALVDHRVGVADIGGSSFVEEEP
jgi:hypothetical protein